MTDPEIAAQVITVVADVLGEEPEEITLEQTFFGDLGGESLDHLDLAFRLERHYGVKIPVNQLQNLADVPINELGMVTPEGLQSIRQNFPFLDLAAFEREPRAERLSDLVTIEAIARMVEFYLAKAKADAR